ncbi:hypothetical protein SDRG_10810 [Saprolegnia diclina VS20]|uniref:Uncharacterized protein n=1 Tax=Saprolegnia diclina (strain VS20) TaxID=1156394 RepID=T0QDJ3_SAPDV|nr:hypothetical protein SDRG_10810 [Saprolegnia diclina VS20]EQC31645.1 hypothetical protein SDRG_10810 [Saprolegnia diclina VS20]|eukprot:XP_008615044.1 hypothetical protein SDRG_10810 [Saprolegnia diclina VS20]
MDDIRAPLSLPHCLAALAFTFLSTGLNPWVVFPDSEMEARVSSVLVTLGLTAVVFAVPCVLHALRFGRDQYTAEERTSMAVVTLLAIAHSAVYVFGVLRAFLGSTSSALTNTPPPPASHVFHV